jgi:hypothetical protein
MVVPLVTSGWCLSFGADYTFGTRQDAPGWVFLIGNGLCQDGLGQDDLGRTSLEALCSESLGRFSLPDYY